MVIIASGNTAKGNLSDEESVTAITLEPDGKTTDKIKGKFSITSIKDPSQGIFMTVKLTRVKEE